MTSPGSDPITDDAPEDVAASFVLGLLEADAWVLAANRCASDPAFADEVEAWEARLTPLALAVDSQLPSRDLWPDVLRRLPANSGAGVRASLALWRGLTAAAGFIAVACLTFVMLEGRPDANKAMTPGPSPPIGPVAETVPSEPLQVALLKPEQGPTAFVATLDRARGVMTIAPGSASARRGHDLELWMIAPGGKPQPLGVIPVDHPARMPMPRAFAGKGDSPIILAISVEPKGGSPTGQPTGPVVASGHFSAV